MVGDLGVQGGSFRWLFVRHALRVAFGTAPEKLPKGKAEGADEGSSTEVVIAASPARLEASAARVYADGDAAITAAGVAAEEEEGTLSPARLARAPARGSSPDASTVPPAPVPSTPALA
jgi:hypothetical protein